MSEDRKVEVSLLLLLDVMEKLRLAHIYALKHERRDLLPADFKPHKWDDEVEFSNETLGLYRRLSAEITPQVLGEKVPLGS